MYVKGLVSTIIAFLNAERFLEEAIESVIGQTYTHWDLVLVDDGSTDSGAEIAHRYTKLYPDRICYLEHPGHRNLGMCTSRNLGIRHSHGEYVAILDADDIWLPDKLQQQVALMEAHPEAGLVYGLSEYCYWAGSDWQAEKNHVPQLAPSGLYYPPSLLKLCFPLGTAGTPCPSDFLLRRPVLERIGGFEECFDLDHQLYEDQAFLAKINLNVPVFVAAACWDKYRCHDLSCSATSERSGRVEAARRFYFDWLANFLRCNHVCDREIWSAVARCTWRYHHPLLAIGASVIRRSIQLLRSDG